VRWLCDADGDGCHWVPGWRHYWWGHRSGPGWGYGYGYHDSWRPYGWYGAEPYGYGSW
jgi:hypothetical protein